MKGVDKAFADTFGNYMLHGIEEVHLPASTPWWPQTLGWKVVAAIFIAASSYWLFLTVKQWWRNRYRRQAISELTALQANADNWQTTVEQLPFLLKATALQAYPRVQVAQLSGQAWLAFLDTRYDGPRFCEGVGSQLVQVGYQPRAQWRLSEPESRILLQMSHRWIKEHTPADLSGSKAEVSRG